MAVLAPIPSARVAIATAVKAGFRRSVLPACRRSRAINISGPEAHTACQLTLVWRCDLDEHACPFVERAVHKRAGGRLTSAAREEVTFPFSGIPKIGIVAPYA